REKERDYADSGLSIQAALLDLYQHYPDKANRPALLWGGLPIQTADSIAVPSRGVVRGEFLSSKPGVEQGFDLQVDGWIELKEGEQVKTLRTWNDPKYEPVVEYPYFSKDGR